MSNEWQIELQGGLREPDSHQSRLLESAGDMFRDYLLGYVYFYQQDENKKRRAKCKNKIAASIRIAIQKWVDFVSLYKTQVVILGFTVAVAAVYVFWIPQLILFWVTILFAIGYVIFALKDFDTGAKIILLVSGLFAILSGISDSVGSLKILMRILRNVPESYEFPEKIIRGIVMIVIIAPLILSAYTQKLERKNGKEQLGKPHKSSRSDASARR